MGAGSSEGVLGTGTSITFGTSAWTAQITSLAQSGRSRPAIKTSHLGTPDTTGTGSDTFQGGVLVDEGSIDIGYNFRPGAAGARPPIGGSAETITIEFDSTEVTGAQAAFSGFFTDDGWDAPHEDNMTGSGTVKISGAVTYTAAASA